LEGTFEPGDEPASDRTEEEDHDVLDDRDVPPTEAFCPSGLTMRIFDSDEVERALKRLDESNSENRNKLAPFLKRMLERGPIRRLVQAPDLCALDCLNSFPNFSESSSFIREQVALARLHEGAVSFSPILLVGAPGVGKTHYASAVADALGIHDFELLPLANLTSGWILGGSSASWSNSKIGRVAGRLVSGESGSPLLILDEICKANGSNQFPVASALLPYLERITSQHMTDEYLGEDVRFDASKVLWIATANDLDRIPEPVLSRFVVFEIPNLTTEQTRQVAASMFETMLDEPFGLFFEPLLSDEVLNSLQAMTPREIRLSLTRALGRSSLRPAPLGGKRRIEIEDLATTPRKAERRHIGFCCS
jgi:ATP-dependent Lon protease